MVRTEPVGSWRETFGGLSTPSTKSHRGCGSMSGLNTRRMKGALKNIVIAMDAKIMVSNYDAEECSSCRISDSRTG